MEEELPSAVEEVVSDPLFQPFVRYDRYGELGLKPQPIWEKMRLALLTVTIVPIKCIMCLCCIISYYLCIRLASLLPQSQRTPIIAALGKLHCRACLLSMGFVSVKWVRVSHTALAGDQSSRGTDGSAGSNDTAEEAQAVGIVSNHCSWVDIPIHMSHSFPSFVAKEETKGILFIGLIRCGGWVMVCVLGAKEGACLHVDCICTCRGGLQRDG